MVEVVANRFDGKNISRTIVGYDLRRKPINIIFMSSYDEERRYEELLESNRKYLSAMNLFNEDPSFIETITLPDECEIIAFDLPDFFLKVFLSGNVSTPGHAVPITHLPLDWNFIGFDVIDPYTQNSVFDDISFGISCEEWMCYRDSFRNTKYGLISDFEQALILSIIADGVIHEHKPFIPSGVWLKVRQ